MDPASLDLTNFADDLITSASESERGVAMKRVPSENTLLRVVGIGLRKGSELAEHSNPGEAVLQVMRGTATLRWEGGSHDLAAGMLVTIPQAKHSVLAHEDSALMLTAVNREAGNDGPAHETREP